MALFGKKETTAKKPAAKKTAVKKAPAKAKAVSADIDTNRSWVLRRPHITEKSTIVPETLNAYVFEVHPDATSLDVKAAVNDIYKVKPVKVNMLRMASKTVKRRRGRATKTGSKGGGKKAYIYLKKGDKIEFV